MQKQQRSLDHELCVTIKHSFPDSTEPDKENYLPDGRQYKAADHFIPKLRVFIERKSIKPAPRNDPETGEGVYWLKAANDIRKKQGQGKAYLRGSLPILELLKDLPNQKKVSFQISERPTLAIQKHIRDSGFKFFEQSKYIKLSRWWFRPANITIISDEFNTEVPVETFAYFSKRAADKVYVECGVPMFVCYMRRRKANDPVYRLVHTRGISVVAKIRVLFVLRKIRSNLSNC